MVNAVKEDILLVIPPAWDEVIPPLGVCQLKSYLEKNGYPTKIIDLNLKYFVERDKTGFNTPELPWHPLNDYIFEKFITKTFSEVRNNVSSNSFKNIDAVIDTHLFTNEKDKERKTREILDIANKELLNYISQNNIKLVGFSTFSPSYQSALYLAKKLKEEILDILIVLGGPQVSYLKEEVLYFPWVDVAIPGEGEFAFLDLLKKTESKKKSSLCYLRDKNNKINSPQQTIDILDLDKLPFPNFDDYNFEKMPISLIPMSLTRGCSRNCYFCGVHMNKVNGSFRSKTIKHQMSEIEYYLQTYGIRNFAFTDSILNYNSSLLKKLCNTIISNKLEIKWGAQLLPQVNKEDAEYLKKAGGKMVYCDPETGSQRIADLMGKDVKIINAKKSIQNLSSVGINVSSWFMFGFPGETEKDFLITRKFIGEIKQNVSEFIVLPFALYRRCKIYQDPKRFGIDILCDIPGEYLAMYSENGHINFGYSSVGAKRAIQIWEELEPETQYPFERLKEYKNSGNIRKKKYSYITQLKERMGI